VHSDAPSATSVHDRLFSQTTQAALNRHRHQQSANAAHAVPPARQNTAFTSLATAPPPASATADAFASAGSRSRAREKRRVNSVGPGAAAGKRPGAPSTRVSTSPAEPSPRVGVVPTATDPADKPVGSVLLVDYAIPPPPPHPMDPKE
jgi:hypothetical protein